MAGFLSGSWARLRSINPIWWDGLVAAFLSFWAVAEQTLQGQPWPSPAVFGVTLPLLIRRRFPIICASIQFVMLLFAFRTNGIATVAAFVIGVYSVGVHSSFRAFTLVGTLGAAVVVALVFGDSVISVPSAAAPFLLLIPAWLAGNAVRASSMRADALHERAQRLEREHESAKAAAVASERSRIARELHDVVAHNVSVMVVQAGAARQVVRNEPEASEESLLAIEAGGRQALTELRRLLELLSEDGSEPELSPQPGVNQLEKLVDRIAAAGQPVELRVEGEAHQLSPGLDLTVYRIVQEGLTNALKYARGARTEVLLRYGESELSLEILDDGAVRAPDVAVARGHGRGLVGMRQRVAMYGGELEAGLRPGRGYAIRARLPMEPA